jgi:transcriptional regulator with XRE-family HTH domain
MFNTVSIGHKISDLRKQKNMTQMELADLMGVSYQAVSNWERGNSMPDISKLEDLAKVLDVTIDQLLGNESPIQLAKHIIAGDSKEYIQTENVGLEDLEEIAPILKPDQTGDAFKAFADKADKPMTLGDLSGIAPFLANGYLDELVKDIEVGSLRDLGHIAPFLSRASIDSLAERALEVGDIRAISEIAPFVSKEALEGVVSRANLMVDLNDLAHLAPFLRKKTLGDLVLKALDAGSECSITELTRLAPFLPKETLHQLADKLLKEKGVSALGPIGPFL